MKMGLLTFAAALIPLAIGASAADAQVIVGPGYYDGPGYRGAAVLGSPRYFYGPRRWYGARFAGAYPAYRPYAGGACYRWRTVPTAIGPQWRMVNVCYAPASFVPAYPYRYRARYY